MKQTDKKKMDKSVAFHGRMLKIIIPRASIGYFKLVNALETTLFKGRKSRRFRTEEIFIPQKDGNMRACICSEYTYKKTGSVYENAPENASTAENTLKNSDGVLQKTSATADNKSEKYSRPAILWIHGGGYSMGVPEQDFVFIDRILSAIDAVILMPDYTLSVEKPYPKALTDCYDALLWLKENAEKLGADKNKIFVGGESAGGGLCAALCLYARDKGEVNIAFQMPLYPMLDDRPTRTNVNNNMPCWDTQSNIKAWKVYLGDLYGTDKVPYYAAPARVTDFTNLPPAITYIGDVEPFYAETVDYFENLKKAGISAEYRVYPGCYHAFDVYCPNSNHTKDAIEFFKNQLVYAAKNYSAKQK